jgi:maltooligosyltrehalose trehalohydrolase
LLDGVDPMTTSPRRRRLPIGAEPSPDGSHFRVWAPSASRVEVVVEGDGASVALSPEPDGYHAGLVPGVCAGARYRYRLDGGDALPDPASRYQPDGPHGPSVVVDPGTFAWNDEAWRGVSARGLVVYEMHVGTFTLEGTWAAAAEHLAELADLGVTLIEMLPVHDFAGRFGWGYDGVNLFAPTRLYGTPDDLRAFVDRAHALGIGVVLDVVYNHFGPDGNYLARFAQGYFTDAHTTDWGEALRFYGESSAPVRELIVANAGYWIDEFHFDGLRLDATQNIYDRWDDHVLARIVERGREAARGRTTFFVGENEPQDRRMLLARAEGGAGMDALWNDDFHHSAMVAATGRAEAYYSDYAGAPQELISALKWGFLYQGQHYRWQKQPRGSFALDRPATSFVTFLQNHDQVANTARGARLGSLVAPPTLRALTALFLLAPPTPMLFQGQEFGATTPFLYFADHGAEIAPLVQRGRAEFLSQFPSYASKETQAGLPDPCSEASFTRSKLDRARDRNDAVFALHRDLLALRRRDPVLAAQRSDAMHGAVLGAEAFALRFFDAAEGDRLLVVNLGRDLALSPLPEPLLAPPREGGWELLLSTESPRYGGDGTPPIEDAGRWSLPGRSASFFRARAPVANGRTDGASGAHDTRRNVT